MTSAMEIAKAGWMHRQSSVLHRWKKNWFVLYQDGILRYFDSPDSSRAEEVYVLRSCCKLIKTGKEVHADPPDQVKDGKNCFLELDMRDGGNLVLCAESVDDMKAWQYALEEARTMTDPNIASGYTRQVPVTYNPYPYSPYGYNGYGGGYPGQVIAPPQGSQMIQNPDGTVTIINPTGQVVYIDRPYRRRYDDGYLGAGTGFMAGAMLGSAMMWPMVFW
ncbi:pleckstrin homology domain-containing family B member 2-like isoform X1 [Littorina saxatilis]|uniref:PH domain-containing protein n=1 Tax=Littorina saxatilis TaxID=31220 RepID=A0AAN9G0G3_9CAEN